MGGKEAKERRRLKRLQARQQNDGDTGTPSSRSDPTKPAKKTIQVVRAAADVSLDRTGVERKHTTTPAKPSRRYDVVADAGEQRDGRGVKRPRQHQRGGDANVGSASSEGERSRQQGSNNKGRNDGSRTKDNQKHGGKIKKPKHLKRKLMQLAVAAATDDDAVAKEREVLQRQAQAFQEKKAKRALAFEKKIRTIVGGAFDEDTFLALTTKGTSTQDIIETMRRAPGKKLITKEGVRDRDDSDSAGYIAMQGNDLRSNKQTKKKEDASAAVLSEKPNVTSVRVKNRGDGSSEAISASSDSDSSSSEKSTGGRDSTDRKDAGSGRAEINVEAKSISCASLDRDVRESSSEMVSDSSDVDSSSDSSDSDSESDPDLAPKRQRGRGRRNMKDADSRRAKLNEKAKEKSHHPTDVATSEEGLKEPVQKTSKKDDKRRCIGRKPVTDFEVGKTYEGKVIYLKPFGAFIDIGSHSDAFCHISRVSDNFVENIADVLGENDIVSARVVEIERRRKRITVSLQTDARIEDENASQLARDAKRKKAREKSGGGSNYDRGGHSGERIKQLGEGAQDRASERVHDQFHNTSSSNAGDLGASAVDESQMTRAELKRARKLQRRADRRAQGAVE